MGEVSKASLEVFLSLPVGLSVALHYPWVSQNCLIASKMFLADLFEQDIFKCRPLLLISLHSISLFSIASIFNYIIRVLSLFIVSAILTLSLHTVGVVITLHNHWIKKQSLQLQRTYFLALA